LFLLVSSFLSLDYLAQITFSLVSLRDLRAANRAVKLVRVLHTKRLGLFRQPRTGSTLPVDGWTVSPVNRYSDHDVTDTGKFLEFSKKVYLDTMGIGNFSEPINQPKQWATGLAKTGILGLLEISHFGRFDDVRNCIKQLMEVTHGGYLWVEEPVLIDV
jgi:hypothetical protein